MKEYYYVEMPAQAFPESPYDLSDELFIVPICSLSDKREFKCSIALCREANQERAVIKYDLLRDFVIFHCFICGDSTTYEAFGKTRLTPVIKSFESRKDFIQSLGREEVHAWAFTGDFDCITPFHANIEHGLSYRLAFQKFIETKDRDDNLYNCIRLYVFSCNFRKINKIYQNDSLSLALLYTILDTLLGRPKECGGIACCNKCNRELRHDEESLAEYQRGRIRELLENKKLDSDSVDSYVKFLTQINRIRSATYHHASYFYGVAEWGRQIENQPRGDQESREEWPFDRVIDALKENPPDYTARELARFALSDFVGALLLNKLVEADFFPKIPKWIHVTGKTYLTNDKSKPH